MTPPPVDRHGPAVRLTDELAARAGAMLTERPRVVVGITGPPGAGKSTLASRLLRRLGEQGILAGQVPMDGFHLSNAVLDELDRHDRKGAPDTFDVEGYIAALDRVRALDGADEPPEVLVPVYRRDLHEPVAAGARVSGRGVVVTEGNYLALETDGWGPVRERIDVLVFLSVVQEELIERLIARHREFGRSIADAAHWVRAVDVPNARLVSASAERCDEVWTIAAEDVAETTTAADGAAPPSAGWAPSPADGRPGPPRPGPGSLQPHSPESRSASSASP